MSIDEFVYSGNKDKKLLSIPPKEFPQLKKWSFGWGVDKPVNAFGSANQPEKDAKLFDVFWK